jgi:hypothetical protein
MAIKVPFIAEVGSFIKGTTDMVRSLLDVSDSLDEIGRTDVDVSGIEELGTSADAAGLKVSGLGEELDSLNRVDTTGVESELKEIGTAGDAAAEKVEQSFSAAFKSLKADGQTATQAAKADLDGVSKHGSRAADEFKQEAKQNVAESLSSFQGDASSAVDAVQSTFGGLASALGPAGIIGVSVAAAGIGMARGLFAKSKQEAEDLRELVGNIFDELRSNSGVLGDSFQSTQIADLLRDGEEFKKTFGTDIPSAMRSFGSGFSTVMQGLTGDSQDVVAAQNAVADSIAAAEAQFGTYVDDLGNVRLGNADLEATFGKVSIALQKQGVAVGLGVTTNQAYTEATKGMTTETGKSTTATDKDTAAKKAAKRSIQDLAAATLAASNTAIGYEQALDDATKAAKENGKTHDLNTQKGRDNVRALNSQAAALLALAQSHDEDGQHTKDYNKIIDQNRQEFIDVARQMGYTQTQAETLANKYGLIPKKVKTNVTDEGSAKRVQERIDNIKSSGVPVPISPDMSGFDASVSRYLNGKKYYVTLYARPGKAVPT